MNMNKWKAFSLPRNLEIEYGYYISYLHVTERKYVSSKCSEILSQIASEGIWEVYKFKIFRGGMSPDPPSRHAHVLHTTIILLLSCFPQLKTPHETLVVAQNTGVSHFSYLCVIEEGGHSDSDS